MRQCLITLAAVLASAEAFAHEGHGTPGEGQTVAHYVTEPLHVGGWIVAAIACGLIGRAMWKRYSLARVR